MKVRLGFVSNSSSSSYIIALREDEEKKICPTCGRVHFDLIEHIDRNTGSYLGDVTELIHRGREATRHSYQEEVDRLKAALAAYNYHPPGEVYEPSRGWDQPILWGEKIQWAEGDLKYNQDILDAIDATEGDIFEIRISYHDETTHAIYHHLKQSGILTEVKSDH